MIVGAREASVATMRGARHTDWGSQLEVAELPRPEPAAGEIRMRVRATSVNPIDIYTGLNAGYEQSMRLPFVPGWDVAGVVDALGYGVTRHALGDSVFGLAAFPSPAGAYAEYLVVPAFHVVPMPQSTSFVEAACLPMAALTAWQMLDAARVTSDDRVLISGASGGVGHMAVQLAVARGASVTALARPHDQQILLGLGAHTCVDYADLGAVGAAGPVDAALDLVGGEFGRSLFGLVVEGGVIALATAWSIPGYERDAAEHGIRAASCLVEPDPVALQAIAELVDGGKVRVVVGAEFELRQAADAQRWVSGRSGFGKAAIVVEHAEV